MRVLVLLLALVPLPLFAQNSFSPEATQQCLAEVEMKALAQFCAGESAELCFEASDGSDEARRVCIVEELAWWENELEQAFAVARGNAEIWDNQKPDIPDATRRVDLVDQMQSAWRLYRDATCAHRADIWSNGGNGSGIELQACYLFETAGKLFAVHENMREGW